MGIFTNDLLWGGPEGGPEGGSRGGPGPPPGEIKKCIFRCNFDPPLGETAAGVRQKIGIRVFFWEKIGPPKRPIFGHFLAFFGFF